MSISRRVKAMEKVVSPTERPHVFVMSTYYENEEGGSDFGFAMATVNDSPTLQGRVYGTVSEESFEQFCERVSDEVFKATGVRPVDDEVLRPRLQRQQSSFGLPPSTNYPQTS